MVLIIMLVEICLLIFLEQWIYRKYWDQNLRVTLQFREHYLYEKQMGILEEVVENHKRLPLPVLKVKFQCSRHLLFDEEKNSSVSDLFYRNDAFAALPMKRVTRRLPFVADHRGYYTIKGIDLLSKDLFYTRTFLAETESQTEVYVLPKPFESGEFRLVLQKINGEALTKRHLITDPFENRGIRPYEPYDSVRMVNWKATAKTGSLQVNQKNYTALKAVRLFLNLDDHSILRREELLEYAIRMAARVADEMLAQGIRVSVYANTADCITGNRLDIKAGAGVGQKEEIMRGLARIDLEKPTATLDEFLAKLSEDTVGTCTVIFSPNQYEEFQEILRTYKQKDPDFIWICPVSKSWDQSKHEMMPELEKQILRVACERS